MRYTLFDNSKDGVILVARVLLSLLFILFGWPKLVGFAGTVGYMGSLGLPLPWLAALIAVVMEFVVGVALLVGFYTRPLALLLALYTLGTALVGHHYWSMTGAEAHANMINFYKNVSIMGGCLLLCVTGPGRFSLDRR